MSWTKTPNLMLHSEGCLFPDKAADLKAICISSQMYFTWNCDKQDLDAQDW